MRKERRGKDRHNMIVTGKSKVQDLEPGLHVKVEPGDAVVALDVGVLRAVIESETLMVHESNIQLRFYLPL